MNALLFDSILPHSTVSTSQPPLQKILQSLGSPPLRPVVEHSTSRVGRWQRASRDPLVHRLSSSSSSKHSFFSTNPLLGDRLCLICGAHSSTSCPVCDEDFCSNHLDRCLGCDNQYCGRCLDDHRVDGHWTDSDTAAELNRGQRDRSVPAHFPIGIDGFAAAPNRTQCLCGEQATCQAHSTAISAEALNQSSFPPPEPNNLNQCTSLLARILRTARSCLSWLAEGALVKMFSQSETHLEACR